MSSGNECARKIYPKTSSIVCDYDLSNKEAEAEKKEADAGRSQNFQSACST